MNRKTRLTVNIIMVIILIAVGIFWGASIFVYKRAEPMYRIAQIALWVTCAVAYILLAFEHYDEHKKKKNKKNEDKDDNEQDK
jgi:Ca2+/Na+ antiporter